MVVYVVTGDCILAVGCTSQPGLRLTQRSADPWRRWWPPPLPRPHLPGRWWAASMVGSSRGFSLLGCRSQGSDFNAASLVVKSRR